MKAGPGLAVPVRLAFAIAIAATVTPAGAQPRPAAPAPSQQAAPAAPSVAAPDNLTVTKLVWSTIAALDQANQTGNYSVLRDLGAPSFQSSNSAATLGTIFQNLRNAQIDLGYALVVQPVYDFAPAIVQGGMLRVRGSFPLRPGIAFDMLFQNVGGKWRIFGLGVAPLIATSAQQNPKH